MQGSTPLSCRHDHRSPVWRDNHWRVSRATPFSYFYKRKQTLAPTPPRCRVANFVLSTLLRPRSEFSVHSFSVLILSFFIFPIWVYAGRRFPVDLFQILAVAGGRGWEREVECRSFSTSRAALQADCIALPTTRNADGDINERG